MSTDFIHTDTPNCHIQRRREIAKKYSEVRELMGHNPRSAFWITLLVCAQMLIAWLLNDAHWLIMIVVAYGVGAFINHALYVQTHECTHDLVFKSPTPNKIFGILCDFPLVFPSAMAFRKYHRMHHKFLGEYEGDPDIVGRKEADLVKNSTWRKALWMFFFAVSQAMRPAKTDVPLWDRWVISNLVACVLVNAAVWAFLGGQALLYLALSTLFALGLHPLGGRWIQEHYITREGQETYSYYGPLNKLAFNMGFHNEHHDFMNIPWNNLPKLKALAPEYYDSLKSYRSWTWVIWNFIFNREMSPYSRILHPDRLREFKQDALEIGR